MLMLVMDIRKMRMAMDRRFMHVFMGMRLALFIVRPMRMPMMFIVNMRMGMVQSLMRMQMQVPLRQV